MGVIVCVAVLAVPVAESAGSPKLLSGADASRGRFARDEGLEGVPLPHCGARGPGEASDSPHHPRDAGEGRVRPGRGVVEPAGLEHRDELVDPDPVLDVRRESAHEGGRHRTLDADDVRHPLENPAHDRLRVALAEGRPARGGEGEDGGQRPPVRGFVRVGAVDDTRVAVPRRVRDRAGHCQARILVDLRDSEVYEHGPVRAQHDVGRLEVSVEDPRLVDRLDRLAEMLGELDQVLPFEHPRIDDVLLQRRPIYEFRHNKGLVGVGLGVQDLGDVTAAHLLEHRDFPAKALPARVVHHEGRMQKLEGDADPGAVLRLEDGGHAARADSLDEPVPANVHLPTHTSTLSKDAPCALVTLPEHAVHESPKGRFALGFRDSAFCYTFLPKKRARSAAFCVIIFTDVLSICVRVDTLALFTRTVRHVPAGEGTI